MARYTTTNNVLWYTAVFPIEPQHQRHLLLGAYCVTLCLTDVRFQNGLLAVHCVNTRSL